MKVFLDEFFFAIWMKLYLTGPEYQFQRQLQQAVAWSKLSVKRSVGFVRPMIKLILTDSWRKTQCTTAWFFLDASRVGRVVCRVSRSRSMAVSLCHSGGSCGHV